MNTFHHDCGCVIKQPSAFSSSCPVQPGTASSRGTIKRILGAATMAVAVAAPAWSAAPGESAQQLDAAVGQSAEHTADPEAAARAQWSADQPDDVGNGRTVLLDGVCGGRWRPS
jgi:hypothetical protein